MPKKLTDEQEQLLDSIGIKNQWIWALCAVMIALIIVVVNIICRYSDNNKLNRLEYTMGVVSSSQTSREWIGRNTLINFSLSVEYTPKDSDITYSWYDHDGPYDFLRKGDVLRVYYDKDAPEKAYPAKIDWLTGVYIRIDKSYNTALYISIFPLIVGIYLFADYNRVKKRVLKTQNDCVDDDLNE